MNAATGPHHRAERKAALLRESAALREQFGQDWRQSVTPALALGDRVGQGARWLHRHRWWGVAVGSALAIWRPKAAVRGSTSLAARGWGLWQAWSRWRPVVVQAWAAYQALRAPKIGE